jgi:hypothetical protein
MSEPTRAEVEASRGSGNALAYVPRLVLGALGDLRSIANSVAVLPEVSRALMAIEQRVDSLDDEVRRMRGAVESIGTDVIGMRESVEPLEGELEELRKVMHPLKRVTGRIGRAGRGARAPRD